VGMFAVRKKVSFDARPVWQPGTPSVTLFALSR